MSTATTSTPTHTVRYSDAVAHRHAIEHAVEMLGLDAEPAVIWDRDHHLQGHLDVLGIHLVLIAPRTDDHGPRLLTEVEWDGMRRGLLAA